MKLDKVSKQNIRRQKRKDVNEQHVQEVLGYLLFLNQRTSSTKEHLMCDPSCIKTLQLSLHNPTFFRQCNQIHQKREEMAERIQEISGETQQLKAKIQSLRDVCSKETERAQVGPRPWRPCTRASDTLTLLSVCRLCTTLCPPPWTSCTAESRRTSLT